MGSKPKTEKPKKEKKHRHKHKRKHKQGHRDKDAQKRTSKSKKKTVLIDDEARRARKKSKKDKKRKKKEKEKDKRHGQTNEVTYNRNHTLDLSTLSREEVKVLKRVIKKDEAEMRAMDERVCILRNEIEELRQLSTELMDPSSSSRAEARCPRCSKEFRVWHSVLPFLDRGVRCQTCRYRVCKDCRFLQPNGLYLCRLCVCYRQEKLLTGEWMDPAVGGVHSTDLIKLSLRDKKNILNERKKKDQSKAERANNTKGVTADGVTDKKRIHWKRSRSKSTKSKEHKHDKESRRGRRDKGKHANFEKQGTTVETAEMETKEMDISKDEHGVKKECGGGEGGSRVTFTDNDIHMRPNCEDGGFYSVDHDNEDYADNDDYKTWYGTYSFGYACGYDYYFDYENESDVEEGTVGEDFKSGTPVKESPCVSLNPDLAHEYTASGRRRIRRPGWLPKPKLASQLEIAWSGLRKGKEERGAGDQCSFSLDYSSTKQQPPPYQDHMHTWPEGFHIASAPSHGDLEVVSTHSYCSTWEPEPPAVALSNLQQKKQGRPSLWKRMKVSLAKALLSIMPEVIRHRYDSNLPSDDAEFEEKNASSNVALDDINWNFQPGKGGPQHGGGRIGVGRPMRGPRGRGRGRGHMRGMGARLLRGGRGGRGARGIRGGRGGPFRGRGVRGGRGGRGLGGRRAAQSVSSGKKKKSKSKKKKKKSRKSKQKTESEEDSGSMESSKEPVLAGLEDLQKKLKDRAHGSGDGEDRPSKEGGAGDEQQTGSQEMESEDLGTTSHTITVYQCPEKDTESVASQTEKPPRSKLMQLLCPFCRFNIEMER